VVTYSRSLAGGGAFSGPSLEVDFFSEVLCPSNKVSRPEPSLSKDSVAHVKHRCGKSKHSSVTVIPEHPSLVHGLIGGF
jgi:hypothetical protein